MTALIGKKGQRGGSGVAETQMATEEEGDEETNSNIGDRQGGDRHRTEWAEIDRTEIHGVMNRKEIVGQLGDIG
jgi:hypothetical protein